MVDPSPTGEGTQIVVAEPTAASVFNPMRTQSTDFAKNLIFGFMTIKAQNFNNTHLATKQHKM